MLNDQLIGAYLDGELDQEKRALVEYWLANDAGAAARIERMRAGDALLRRALPRINADADDPIAALINAPPNVVNLRAGKRTWVRSAAALAAACVLGVLAGRLGDSAQTVAALDPHMRLGAEITQILDTLPSGQSAAILGGEVQMALSVQTEGGALCRQFRAVSGADAVDALACNEGGVWRLQVQAAAIDGANSYRTAGAGASPVDAAMSAVGRASVLSESEERVLISARWRR